MALKTKTITLSYPWFSDKAKSYQVEKVGNTTEYHPGDILNESQVNDLCRKSAWKVIIVASVGSPKNRVN